MNDLTPHPEPVEGGFACPGPMYLPGLLMIPAVHVGILAGMRIAVRKVDSTWEVVAAAFGLVVVFWLTFWFVSRLFGGWVAINLLGIASLLTGVVLILGVCSYAVMWLLG
jgi:hypothetical protein